MSQSQKAVKSDNHQIPSLASGNFCFLKEMGRLAGMNGIHLMCNNGADTCLLASRCSKITGIDYSHSALAWAKIKTIKHNNIAFVRSNVVDYARAHSAQFDFAVAAWGVLCWIDNLDTFAKAVYRILKPGGFFYLCDAHPLINCLDSLGRISHNYPLGKRQRNQSGNVVLDYHAPSHVSPVKMHWWFWGLGEIVTSMTHTGFRVLFFNEHDFLWPHYFGTERIVMQRGTYGYLPNIKKKMPLSFSIKLIK